MEIGWIYHGFSGAIANFVVWISLFFPVYIARMLENWKIDGEIEYYIL